MKAFNVTLAFIFAFVFVCHPVLSEPVLSEERFVSNKKELKIALEKKVATIYITDKKLSENSKKISTATKVAIGVAIVTVIAISVAAVNWWNPVGWGSGLIAGGGSAVEITLVIAIIAIGGVYIGKIINNDYESIEIGATVQGVHVYIKLQRKK